MVLRRLPRQLRASALGLPLVLTVGCSTSPAPPPPPKGPSVHIYRDALGHCRETEDNSCPEGVRCNPPPPRPVDCPADLTKLAHDAWQPKLGRLEDGTCEESVPTRCEGEPEVCSPLPGKPVACPDDPKKLAFDRYVPPRPKTQRWRDAQGQCWSAVEIKCPPPEVATCNPPVPRKIDCPTDPTELDNDHYRPAPKAAGHIMRYHDGNCVFIPSIPGCPPDMKCNPPPPRPIACPADPKEIHTDLLKPKTP